MPRLHLPARRLLPKRLDAEALWPIVVRAMEMAHSFFIPLVLPMIYTAVHLELPKEPLSSSSPNTTSAD